MIFETTRFGPVEVSPDRILTAPRGLIGLPEARRFFLLERAPDHPLHWLQSVDDPALAFLVTDPRFFFPDYEFDLSDSDVELLGVETAESLTVWTTLTIRRNPEEITTNLLGPLVIAETTRRIVQIVVDVDRYATRHPLSLVPQNALIQKTASPVQTPAMQPVG